MTFSKLTLFVSALAVAALLFSPTNVSAYGSHTTHPALSQEIVDFYNVLHPEDPLTDEEKQLIMEGSIAEDAVPRPLNHLYDPVRDISWNGEHVGHTSAALVEGLVGVAVSTQKWLKATDWVNDRLAQSRLSRYGGDRTWKQALEYWAEGNRKEAYFTLGHVLHLIEDMGVPDHTRNDAHPPLGGEVTGDDGSPYEIFAKKYNPETIKELKIVDYLNSQGLKPPKERKIEDYLTSLARYSNKYFFSKDTIYDEHYKFPKVLWTDNKFGYGVDENGISFPLARAETFINNNRIETVYFLDDLKKDTEILEAYFQRLSRQVVLHGAGVIELFREESANAAINKEFSNHIVEYDFSRVPGASIFTDNFSLAGEVIRVKNFFAKVTGAVGNAFGELGGLVKQTFTGGKNFKPAAEIDVTDSRRGEKDSPLSGNQLGEKDSPLSGNQLGEKDSPLSGNQLKETPKPKSVLKEQKQSLQPQEEKPTVEPIVKKEEPQKQEQIKIIKTFSGCSDGQINVNSADSATLENIVGIGPVYAQRIIDLRAGEPFYSLDDLTKVLGIGEKTVENIRSQNLACAADKNDSSFTPYQKPAETQSAGSSGSSGSSGTTVTAEAESIPPKILISEFQVASAENSSYEFVELYNPNDTAVDLAGWDLKKKTASGNIQSLATNISGTIAAKSFFLIGSRDYASTTSDTAPDFVYTTSNNLAHLSTNTVLIFDDSGNTIDEVTYNGMEPDRSLERKALDENGDCVSPQGLNEFLGNSCDTDADASDFVNRSEPNPQNTGSLPEPREAPPAAANFNVSYSSSTEELVFNWGAPAYSGDLTYRIEDINPTSTLVADGLATTTFIKSVLPDEKGRRYVFGLWSVDKDGMRSATTTAEVDIPADIPAGATTVLISEILFDADGSDDGKEFVELYNTATSSFDLAGWRLEMIKGDATTTETLAVFGSKKEDKTLIPANGYLLLGFSNFASSSFGVAPDIVRSASLPNNSTTTPISLRLTSDVNHLVDEVRYTSVSAEAGESLERKAVGDLGCVEAVNDAEFLGNACDNDLADDFVARATPKPQNSKSLPEPRSKPEPAASSTFAAVYSSSSMAITFDWPIYKDAEGVTSTINYKISDITTSGAVIFSSTMVGHAEKINEVGREYTFSFEALDRDGLSSDITTTTVSVPSFLNSLRIYKDPRSATSTKYLIDLAYDGYPFIPDVYQSGDNDSWKALVFYLNSDAKDIEFLWDKDAWVPEELDEVLAVRYKHCSGSDSAAYSLRIPDTADRCRVEGGGLNPNSLDYTRATEDNYILIETASSTSDITLSPSDSITVAFYSFAAATGGQDFQLVAVDKIEYPFLDIATTTAPIFTDGPTTNFNKNESKLAVFWPRAKDPDTLDKTIIYDINFGSFWESVGTATGTEKFVSPGDEFLISLRAKDDFGNVSSIATTTWSYPPADLVFEQTSADSWSDEWGRVNHNVINEPDTASFQSFEPTENFSFNKAVVRIRHTSGNDDAAIRLAVYAAQADGSPEFANPLSEAVVPVQAINNPDPNEDFTFSFADTISVEAGSTYWLVLDVQSSGTGGMVGYFRNSWQNAAAQGGNVYEGGEAGTGFGKGHYEHDNAFCEANCSFTGSYFSGPADWYLKLLME